MIRLTTLCYLEKNDHYLMLHRVSKKDDVNAGKWIGIGIGIVILYILFNVPFIMIQRYNRPALSGLEERLRRRETRKAEKRLTAAEGEVANAHESPDPVG